MDGAFKMIDIRICYEKRESRIYFFSSFYDRKIVPYFIYFVLHSHWITLRDNSSKTNMITLISKASYSWSRQLIDPLFLYSESRKF